MRDLSREDKLWTLKGDLLIAECDKLGIKVNCNKARTQLKESKSKVVERILAFEEDNKEQKIVNEKIIKPSNQEINSRVTLVTTALESAGYIVRPYKSNGNFLTILLYGQKRTYAEVDLNKKFITVYRKTQATNIENFSAERKVNFSYKYSYKLEYSTNYVENILGILE